MQYEEAFVADFAGEFRVSLRPQHAASGVRVEVAVDDLRGGAQSALGKGVGLVPYDGKTVVELARDGEHRFSISLGVTQSALPAHVG
jgi:hypothetical protein